MGTPSHSAIDLSWTDATGTTVPDGYLIKGSDVDYGNITAPSDGTPEDNGTLVRNVTQGTETYTFTGLSASTTYYFKIYPYTNSGTGINYKTDGTVPQDDITTNAAPTLPNAWINEFHYDNAGADVNEFVEVVIPVANTTAAELAKFDVVLYNGNGGAGYKTKSLTNFIEGDTETGMTYYSFDYTTDGGDSEWIS